MHWTPICVTDWRINSGTIEGYSEIKIQACLTYINIILLYSFNKTGAAVFSCRLCFLRAFPFISFIIVFVLVAFIWNVYACIIILLCGVFFFLECLPILKTYNCVLCLCNKYILIYLCHAWCGSFLYVVFYILVATLKYAFYLLFFYNCFTSMRS